MMYRREFVFPTQLGLPILKFLQEELEEPNDIQRRVFQIIEVQQSRESLDQKVVIQLLIKRQRNIFFKREILY
jgi:hypothetical protein